MTTADTALDVAIGAAGAAGLLLLITGYLWVQVRRMRRAQKVVIGSKSTDLVEYAMSLLARVEHAESTAGAAQSAVRALSDRVDGCFERRALLRYDALEGAGAKQSVTIALMDDYEIGLPAVGDPGPRLCAHLHQGHAKRAQRRGSSPRRRSASSPKRPR